jgi:hypothetical protein
MIDFEINYRPKWCDYDDEYFDRGYAVQVDDPKAKVLHGSDVMFKTKRPVTFIYDYPLSHTARIPHTVKSGKWTRTKVCRLIQRDYARIYRMEDKAVGDPGNIPGMFNRLASNGPFGIWGHDIGDLVIEGVTYNPKSRRLSMSIGS